MARAVYADWVTDELRMIEQHLPDRVERRIRDAGFILLDWRPRNWVITVEGATRGLAYYGVQNSVCSAATIIGNGRRVSVKLARPA